jgi:hypothetical protein
MGMRLKKTGNQVKTVNAQGDPVHGIAIKRGVEAVGKSNKDLQSTQGVSYLPVEKIMYDATGNITGIILKTEKGETVVVKVVVAGSHSLSGGLMLKTVKGETAFVETVVTGSASTSGY